MVHPASQDSRAFARRPVAIRNSHSLTLAIAAALRADLVRSVARAELALAYQDHVFNRNPPSRVGLQHASPAAQRAAAAWKAFARVAEPR